MPRRVRGSPFDARRSGQRRVTRGRHVLKIHVCERRRPVESIFRTARTTMNRLLADIRACRECALHLPHGPRPVIQAHPMARLLNIGQPSHPTPDRPRRQQRRQPVQNQSKLHRRMSQPPGQRPGDNEHQHPKPALAPRPPTERQPNDEEQQRRDHRPDKCRHEDQIVALGKQLHRLNHKPIQRHADQPRQPTWCDGHRNLGIGSRRLNGLG